VAEDGRAVLFIQHEDLRGGFAMDVFDEKDDDGRDPHLRAEQMWDIVKNDWPGAIHAIGMNDRARLLMRNRRMRDMGMTGPEWQDENIGTPEGAPLA
jgi:hypothetical protein